MSTRTITVAIGASILRLHHYHLRGRMICTNNLESPMEETDTAVLGAIEDCVLRVDVLETALAKALDMLRRRQHARPSPAGATGRTEPPLEAEVGRLTGAIAAGGDIPALVAALQQRDQRRQQAKTELAAIENVTRSTVDLDVARALTVMREALTDWQGLL